MLFSTTIGENIAYARPEADKDAPILILDEPTSSVDVKTEAAIIDAMERLMAGRTSFMIAHRLTTLDACDVRVALEDGRVAAVTSVNSSASPARDIVPFTYRGAGCS